MKAARFYSRPIGLLLIAILTSCATAPTSPPAPHPSLATARPAIEDNQRFSLQLRFIGLEAGRGQLVIAIYNDAPSFDENGQPFKSSVLLAEGSEATWTLELPAGAYAVKVYQDLDEDGELGRGDFGVPSEPYGFSNDARGTFGPPSWSAARFDLTAGGEQTISLR